MNAKAPIFSTPKTDQEQEGNFYEKQKNVTNYEKRQNEDNLLETELNQLISIFKQGDIAFHSKLFAVILNQKYLKHTKTIQNLTNDFTDLNAVERIIEYSDQIKNIANNNSNPINKETFDLIGAIGNYLETSDTELYNNWINSLGRLTKEYINDNKNPDDLYRKSPTGVDGFPYLPNKCENTNPNNLKSNLINRQDSNLTFVVMVRSKEPAEQTP